MAVAAEKKREDAKAAFMIPIAAIASRWAALSQQVISPQPQVARPADLSFRQVKLQGKREQWAVLVEQWKAVQNQKNTTLNDEDAIKLGIKLENLEQSITAIEQEIQELAG